MSRRKKRQRRKGAKSERERIVAWLRSDPKWAGGAHDAAADAIEDKEHHGKR